MTSSVENIKKNKGTATTATESNNSKTLRKKMGFKRLHPLA